MAEHISHHEDFPEHNPSVAHERAEEDVKAVSGFGIGLAISIVIVAFVMWGLFEWFYAREDALNPAVPAAMVAQRPQQPPEPHLQAQPRLDLKALREGEDELLTKYAWVDPARGIARIPIDQAMNLIVSKGTLTSQPATDLANADGYREIPSVASSGRTTEKIAQ